MNDQQQLAFVIGCIAELRDRTQGLQRVVPTMLAGCPDPRVTQRLRAAGDAYQQAAAELDRAIEHLTEHAEQA